MTTHQIPSNILVINHEKAKTWDYEKFEFNGNRGIQNIFYNKNIDIYERRNVSNKIKEMFSNILPKIRNSLDINLSFDDFYFIDSCVRVVNNPEIGVIKRFEFLELNQTGYILNSFNVGDPIQKRLTDVIRKNSEKDKLLDISTPTRSKTDIAVAIFYAFYCN